MNTTPQTKIKLTTTLDADVYKGLQEKVGSRRIGAYLSKLVRPFVVKDGMDSAYKEMAMDVNRQQEAKEWIDNNLEAPEGENAWQF